MSSYHLRFFPADPQHMPEPAQRQAAQEWLTARFPSAYEVAATLFAAVQFIDQGGNFERRRVLALRRGVYRLVGPGNG